MNIFEMPYIPAEYHLLIKHILQYGHAVERRGAETLELEGVTIISQNPRKRFICRKKVNVAFLLQDCEDVFYGRNPGYAFNYNKNLCTFMNDKGTFDGAYGERICKQFGHNQIWRVVNQLREDKLTRRAIINIHSAAYENYNGKDVCCTMYLHPFVNGDKLDMIAHMRSNDAILGFTYDTQMFQWFQELLAGFLGLDIGYYYHMCDSLHIYTDMAEFAEEIGNDLLDVYEKITPIDCRLNEYEFNSIMSSIQLSNNNARKGSYTEAFTIAKDIRNQYYKSWALSILFYELFINGKFTIAKEVQNEILNEWRVWSNNLLKTKVI